MTAHGLLPLEAAARLAGRPGRVLLDSSGGDDGCGRYSFVACEPTAVVLASGAEVEVRHGAGVERFRGDPLAVLEELACAAGHRVEVGVGEPPVPVAIGYLAYDLGRRFHRKLRPAGGGEPPDLWFGIYGAVWRLDRLTGEREVVGDDPAARERLERALAAPAADAIRPRLGPLDHPAATDRAYRDGFARLMEYIRAGDVYQVNLARRLSAPITREGDALALYRALCDSSPAAYGALLECDATRVVSASPERFLYRAPGGGRLETRPIKGTRRRAGDPAGDRARAEELSRDAKEQAEHLMIVDLERNDLGRIAEIGSVKVDSFARVVELPTLYHVVSTVSCAVRPTVPTAEILRATFPGGSITGAPKLRAMEIIDELEPCRRGVYTGAIGYLGRGRAIDLSIAIRTAVVAGGALRLHVGGGIVADSTLERELEETEEKAAGWRAALRGLSDSPRTERGART